jgi:dephospho-CoA kinase
MILRVGLTGGIASGKSTVLRILSELGCRVTDADSIVARVYLPGQPGHEALVRTYGPSILLPTGAVDRQQLARIAFSTPEESARLNALIHPIVMAEEARMVRAADSGRDGIYVVEATLLLEAGGRARYDKIIVVDVPTEIQLARGEARGMERDEVARRIAHQMVREERLKHADYVIDNRGDAQALRAETERVHAALLLDLEAKKKSPGSPRG